MSDLYDYAIDVEAYRRADLSWLSELDSLAVHAGEPHQRMGIRACSLDDVFRSDEHAGSELALRARLLDERRDDVFATLDGSEQASAAVLETANRWLQAHVPGRVASIDRDMHPLEASARVLQEDLCVIQRDTDGWRLTAAVVCFPTYWRLADKLGRPLAAIHSPVPHYRADLAAKVDQFFDRMEPDSAFVRRNWGFSPHPLLFAPDSETARPLGPAGRDLWLRSERETLVRLESSDAVLFTIRVQLAPLRAVAAHSDLGRRLIDAMQSWSPELQASRGWQADWLPLVVEQLTASR